ncbi:MAG: transferrin receptor-like dimerization domain-containing protein, partial [Limisphaerales bacterium]
WKPKRTVIFCAWDGEEPGLLGSTEWAEQHADELRRKAVAYVNTDGNARGILGIGGSHSLETLAAEVAQVVRDPALGVSVAERMRAAALVRGSADEKKEFLTRKNIRIDALGSGSDYSVFLQHLGIASYYVGFRGEGKGGEYHTCFDTFDHYAKYGDPDFRYGVALAQVCGRLTLRLADADILPFDFNAQAETLNRYIADLVKQADTQREATETHNRLVADDRFRLAADPKEKFIPPARKDPVPHLNFAPLLNAGKNLKDGAAAFHKALEQFLAANRLLGTGEIEQLNQLLYQTERALIHEAGLPRRPWFRHTIYAPGFYTGYGVKTLPGVREGLEERKWTETQEQITHAATALDRLAAQIVAATKKLKE